MKRIIEVSDGVYQVGGDDLSHPADCCVYLLVSKSEAAIIDTGASGAEMILDNITSAGFDLKMIRYIVVTHGHIDHIGGLKTFKDRLNAEIIAHKLDLPAIEEGLPELTAAHYYGINYEGVKVDKVLHEDQSFNLGEISFTCIHTPGHTPGSISVCSDISGQRILFGQDIHGPFSREWGSDKNQWRQSMKKLLDLNADILCEGHFGIYSPAIQVKEYIESYLRRFSR